MGTRDRARDGLLIAGLILAAAGQGYLSFRREYIWDGVAFWAVGILLMCLAVRRLRRRRDGAAQGAARGIRWPSALQEHPIRAAAAVAGMGLALLAGLCARQRPQDVGFADALLAWMLGVALLLGAFWPSRLTLACLRRDLQRGRDLLAWVRENGLRLVGVALILLFGLVVRGHDLEHIPTNLGGDEGTQGAEALELVEAPMGNPFSTGWFSVPTISLLPKRLSLGAFGATVRR